MLVAPPGGEPVLLDFMVEVAVQRGARAAGRRRDRLRRRRPGVPHRRRLVRRLRRPGRGSRRRPRASGACRCPTWPRPRSRRARGRRGQPPRRRCCGTCWARSRSPRRSRARATARRPRRRARATCVRDPDLADAIERLAAEGAAPFYTGDIGGGGVGLGARARRDAHARPTSHAYATLAREPVHVRYHGREVLTNPPPSAGGLLDRLRARPARARRRQARTRAALVDRDGGRAGASAPTPSSTTCTSPASWRRSWLAPRLHDARLGAGRRRLGVQRHDHQRRGLGHRGPGHRHPRQQHDGRAGPLARGLVHAPARAAGCRR